MTTAPPITTAEVGPWIVLVQRVDYGEGALRRPTYRCACRRGGDGADRKLVIAYYYSAHAQEVASWAWNGDRVDVEDRKSIASVVERVVEEAREDLDAELVYRRERRGQVDHG